MNYCYVRDLDRKISFQLCMLLIAKFLQTAQLVIKIVGLYSKSI